MAQVKISDVIIKHLKDDVELNPKYIDLKDPKSYYDRMPQLTKKGCAFLVKSNYIEAISIFLEAHAERRDDFWARYFLGTIKLNANDLAVANYYLIDCLEESPNDWSARPIILTNFASCQFKLGNFLGANKSLEEAITLDPKLDVAYHLKATHHIYSNEPNQALEETKKGLEECPKSYRLRYLEIDIQKIIDSPDYTNI